jgi:DNA excision repair protein ERCC-2
MGKYGPIIALHYACLDPSIITQEIFEEAHSAVIMSGKLRPTAMYRDLLGITNCVDREYPSPFPPENKLSIIIPETTTKYSLRGEQMFRHIGQLCGEINAAIPGNVAFFFPSYQLLDAIYPHFVNGNKKIFREKQTFTKEEKEQFITEFKETTSHTGGVLLAVVGANFAEGIDFPGDLLNGVVIVGLPLSRPDIKTRATIDYYEQKFGKGWDYGYIFPAMNKCFQSAGRCIRSETDRGVILYLEERFAWPRYFNLFARENLMVTKEWKPKINEFFSKT